MFLLKVLGRTPALPASEGTKAMETTTAPAESGGLGTDLKLRRALARGDAVWLQSDAQGMVARCVGAIPVFCLLHCGGHGFSSALAGG